MTTEDKLALLLKDGFLNMAVYGSARSNGGGYLHITRTDLKAGNHSSAHVDIQPGELPSAVRDCVEQLFIKSGVYDPYEPGPIGEYLRAKGGPVGTGCGNGSISGFLLLKSPPTP